MREALVDVKSMIDGVLARDKRAVSAALSLVENRHPSAQVGIIQLLEGLAQRATRISFRVGVTGPPGVGKSSLLSALVQEGLKHGRSCAVVAVDPSSTISGGAILGDRARMRVAPDEPLVFFRSLATQGHFGGLSAVVPGALAVLDPAFDFVFVETTGVGQTETEVSDYVDFVVVVVQPGSGDTLQFIKAGLMEIPDLLVVNKADLGQIADRTAAELTHSLASLPRAVEAGVLSVSAETNDGVAAVWDALVRAGGARNAQARHARRARADVLWVERELRSRYGQYFFDVLGEDVVRTRASGTAASGTTGPGTAASGTAASGTAGPGNTSATRIVRDLEGEYLERVRSGDFTR